MTKVYRQGDVLVRSIPAIPANVVEGKRDEHGRLVLAHGERTGHAHAIRDPNVTAFKFHSAEYDVAGGQFDFLLIGGSGAVLNHEHASGVKAEHGAIKLPPGAYEIVQQVEYTPAELVRVTD